MAVRSSAARAVLFILGLAGIGAGLLFLFGFRHFQSRISEISLGIGGLAGGLAMLKMAMTSDSLGELR